MTLKHQFKNPQLLQTALTHSSFANENGCESYERLEFLGDAILGFIVAEELYKRNSNLQEGELTRMRAGHVCEPALAEVSRRLGLDEEVLLGKGETSEGCTPSILCDIFESVLGAMYLDGGLEICREFVCEEVLKNPVSIITTDAKSRLQEKIQSKGLPSPTYKIIGENGPPHDKEFTAAVYSQGHQIGCGKGKNKKSAEQSAASAALGE